MDALINVTPKVGGACLFAFGYPLIEGFQKQELPQIQHQMHEDIQIILEACVNTAATCVIEKQFPFKALVLFRDKILKAAAEIDELPAN